MLDRRATGGARRGNRRPGCAIRGARGCRTYACVFLIRKRNPKHLRKPVYCKNGVQRQQDGRETQGRRPVAPRPRQGQGACAVPCRAAASLSCVHWQRGTKRGRGADEPYVPQEGKAAARKKKKPAAAAGARTSGWKKELEAELAHKKQRLADRDKVIAELKAELEQERARAAASDGLLIEAAVDRALSPHGRELAKQQARAAAEMRASRNHERECLSLAPGGLFDCNCSGAFAGACARGSGSPTSSDGEGDAVETGQIPSCDECTARGVMCFCGTEDE